MTTSKKQISFGFKLVIALVWSLTQISTDIYLPSMPSMAIYFNTSLSLIQYTIVYYTIGFSGGALFFGPISDRIGRRPVIIFSLTLAAFASFIAMVSTSLYVLYFARLLQGIALVGIGSTMRATVRDLCTTREEMSQLGAWLGIVLPVSWAIAPVIGGYIQKYTNWRINFAFLLVYILFFLFYLLRNLKETNSTLLKRPIKYLFTDYKGVLSNLEFVYYNIITALAMSTMISYFTISSLLLQVKIGLTPEQFGYTNLAVAAASIFASYLNNKVIFKVGIDRMLLLALVLLSISGVIFLLPGCFKIINLFVIITPLIILSLSSGIIYPNASAGALSLFGNSAGTAGAIYASLQMLGGAGGSLLITYLVKYIDPQLALGSLLLAQGLIGIALTLLMKRKIVS